MISKKLTVSLVMMVFLLVSAMPAAAAPSGLSDEALKVMHENGDISDRTYEELKALNAKTADSGKPELSAYWDKGLRLKSADNDFQISFGGRILNDWGATQANDALQDAFSGSDVEGSGTEMRQARFYMAGAIYERFTFNAEYDFAGTDADFTDVWAGAKKLPVVGEVRLGHQKEPFSMERLNSLKYTTFIERALTEVFAPGRNTGIKFHRNHMGNRLGWGLGAYKEVKTSDGFDDLNNYNITARLTGVPWMGEEGRRLLHLGLNYSHKFSDEDYGYRLRILPESHLGAVYLVDTGAFENVTAVDLVSPEAAVVLGPLSVQSEYVHSFMDRRGARSLEFSGYYVFCSYFLTGEHRKYIGGEGGGEFGSISPASPFRFGGPGWGSWQAALRYSRLDLNDLDITGGEEENWTAGVNWYLNANLRLSLNYVRAEVMDRYLVSDDGVTLVDDEATDTVLMRCQVEF